MSDEPDSVETTGSGGLRPPLRRRRTSVRLFPRGRTGLRAAENASRSPVTGVARDAFARSLIANLPRLRRYATALAGSASAADDLVQDCIERALRRSHTLQDPDRMAGWLRTILHNLFIDEIRRKPTQAEDIENPQVQDHPALSVAPGANALHIDFVRAMNRLTMEHRQILLLAGLEGLSYSEIAVELDLPAGTVMSRLARAREKLRSLLDPESVFVPVVRGTGTGRVE